MNRMTWIKIHLYLSGVTLVFLAIMALSGSLHLLAGGEAEEVSLVKNISITNPLNKDQLAELFKSELKSIDSNYKYDYVKGSSSSHMSRPTTRTYYTIKVNSDSAKIEKHIPSVRKSLMELHKGHGPKASRNLLGLLGIFVIGSVISGIWLGWTSKALRKVTVLTGLSGLAFFLVLFIL